MEHFYIDNAGEWRNVSLPIKCCKIILGRFTLDIFMAVLKTSITIWFDFENYIRLECVTINVPEKFKYF